MEKKDFYDGESMSLQGKKVVFTGKLSKSRSKMKAEAEAAGADVDTAVSGNTDMLVCGPQVAHNATSSKYKKAKKLGVAVLTEEAYRKILSGKTTNGKTSAPQVTSVPNKSAATKTAKQESVISIEPWFKTLTKAKICALLQSAGNTSYRSSWRKARLVSTLNRLDFGQILYHLSEEQVTAVLAHLRADTTGSSYVQRERVRELFKIPSNQSAMLKALLCSKDEELIRQGLFLFESLGTADQLEILGA